MQNFKIKVDSITSYPEDLYSLGFKNLMKEIMVEERAKFDSESWEVDHEKSLLKGTRYSKIDHLTNVALGAIYNSIANELRKQGLPFEESLEESKTYTNDWIVNSEYSELQKIAKDTIIYSMGSDHWYTFEKQWN
jgi:hypothetical protein